MLSIINGHSLTQWLGYLLLLVLLLVVALLCICPRQAFRMRAILVWHDVIHSFFLVYFYWILLHALLLNLVFILQFLIRTIYILALGITQVNRYRPGRGLPICLALVMFRTFKILQVLFVLQIAILAGYILGEVVIADVIIVMGVKGGMLRGSSLAGQGSSAHRASIILYKKKILFNE